MQIFPHFCVGYGWVLKYWTLDDFEQKITSNQWIFTDFGKISSIYLNENSLF